MEENPTSSSSQAKLLEREWVAIALVAALIIILAAGAWLPQRRAEKAISTFKATLTDKPTITVTLEGAVVQPGSYTFPPGITLREVLKTVPLTKTANKKALNPKQVLYTSQTITIPHKPPKNKK